MITITLTNKQAKVITEALDAYARAKIGQFTYSLDHMVKTPKGVHINRDSLQRIESYLRMLFFPELRDGQSYGITQKEVPDEARIAFDIYQAICYKLPKENNMPEMYKSDIFKTSKTQQLPVVKGDFDDKD